MQDTARPVGRDGGRILAALAQGEARARHRIVEAVEAEQRDDVGACVPLPLRWLVRLPRWMGYELGPA